MWPSNFHLRSAIVFDISWISCYSIEVSVRYSVRPFYSNDLSKLLSVETVQIPFICFAQSHVPQLYNSMLLIRELYSCSRGRQVIKYTIAIIKSSG